MRDTRSLPCTLSERELAERRDKLAGLVGEIVKVEAEKKIATSTFAERLKELGGAAREAAKQIRDRSEYRQVEVSERHDPVRFCVDTYREDTGELVETRPMTDGEIANAKQLMLPSVAEERRRRKRGERPEGSEEGGAGA
jgi:hypothetical protein